MRETLKCLTVRQPYAYLIVNGHKDVENRSWSTTYRGPIIIQSSARVGNIDDFSDLCFDIEDETGITLPADFTTGYTEGIVTLSDVVTNSRSIWAESGEYHWILEDPIKLPAVSVSGKLGLWDLRLKSLQVQPDGETAVSLIADYLTRYKVK